MVLPIDINGKNHLQDNLVPELVSRISSCDGTDSGMSRRMTRRLSTRRRLAKADSIFAPHELDVGGIKQIHSPSRSGTPKTMSSSVTPSPRSTPGQPVPLISWIREIARMGLPLESTATRPRNTLLPLAPLKPVAVPICRSAHPYAVMLLAPSPG